ncbi:MAG: GNAT family N-acetyltransferase [Acidimicrobiales bacterium]
MAIRRFRRADDVDDMALLWEHALAPTWPLLPAGLQVLRDGYVAERDGQVVGMVGTDPAGSVTLVIVHPDHRRQGIGRQLVERALADFRAAGLTAVTAGSGGRDHIWPGIPTDLPGALAFFDALRWPASYVATDLVQDLQEPGADTRLDVATPVPGVSLRLAAVAGLEDAVLDFEDRYFPQWSRAFRKSGEEPLVAIDADGTVVGSLLLAGPGRVSRYWPLLGEHSATIGCVGVSPEREGAGIGSAMVAAASRVLAGRGAGNCHIDWVVRVGFYARLGYRPWREFSMRTLPLRGPAIPT